MTFNTKGPGRKHRTTYQADMAAYDSFPPSIRKIYREAMRDYACEPALKAYRQALSKGYSPSNLARAFAEAIIRHDARALQSDHMFQVWGPGHPQSKDSSKSADELGL